MDTHSLTSQGSKVTLTNWVRLSNAPLLLPRASAVQWNDYVFVLASNDTALLYHNKHNIWSMLPKPPYSYLSPTQAMTLHNGKILTMSANGEVSTFNPQLCRWTERSVSFTIVFASTNPVTCVWTWATDRDSLSVPTTFSTLLLTLKHK